MHHQTILPTSWGQFTLVADEQGLCGLHFPGETPLATATVSAHDHPLLAEAGRQLLAYLEGRLQDFDLPLSMKGTPFQLRVWRELQTISYGHTRSYGELAANIGGRNKARAVGGAAHANPLAIVIPCHRLIGAGGKLTGFGGGLPMKQALLDLERSSLAALKNKA